MIWCLVMSACDGKASVDDKEPISTQQKSIDNNLDKKEEDNSTDILPEETESNDLINNDLIKIEPLSALDYSVIHGNDIIQLDSDFPNFKPYMPEEKIENNYVGEMFSGEYMYKVFMHQYPDYDLYVSNANYNLKNRNFDEYFITQITLKNTSYETARGIAIGSKLQDVYDAYGEDGLYREEEEVDYLIYRFEDMKLSFEIDKNHIINGIILSIFVDDNE